MAEPFRCFPTIRMGSVTAAPRGASSTKREAIGCGRGSFRSGQTGLITGCARSCHSPIADHAAGSKTEYRDQDQPGRPAKNGIRRRIGNMRGHDNGTLVSGLATSTARRVASADREYFGSPRNGKPVRWHRASIQNRTHQQQSTQTQSNKMSRSGTSSRPPRHPSLASPDPPRRAYDGQRFVGRSSRLGARTNGRGSRRTLCRVDALLDEGLLSLRYRLGPPSGRVLRGAVGHRRHLAGGVHVEWEREHGRCYRATVGGNRKNRSGWGSETQMRRKIGDCRRGLWPLLAMALETTGPALATKSRAGILKIVQHRTAPPECRPRGGGGGEATRRSILGKGAQARPICRPAAD